MSVKLGTTDIAGTSINKIVSGFQIFDCKWTDHLLNEQSWLRADTFSWQSGNTYTNAYNHLSTDIQGKSLQSETISSITVQYYLADDGHKVCPASEETNVANLYTATGVAWYYILDTANQRFKLPRTQWGFVGYRDAVGNYVPESLPNITGSIEGYGDRTGFGINGTTGAFYSITNQARIPSMGDTVSGYSSILTAGLNASRSSSTYQDNAPVQQKSTQMYLYFYVGEYTQSALEQSAGITSEQLNNKADRDLSNITVSLSVPTGTIIPYAGSTIPDGWLGSDGSAISRTTYDKLFEKIGTTYGAGDGSTTFNLPNLSGKFALGMDGTYTLGSTGGESTHTLTINEMPSHNHGIKTYNTYSGFDRGGLYSSTGNNSGQTDSTGGGQAHNNMPPYLAVKYIIKY